MKSSAGSALKLLGKNWSANIVAYGLLFTLSYALLVDGGVLRVAPGRLRDSLPHAAGEGPARR